MYFKIKISHYSACETNKQTSKKYGIYFFNKKKKRKKKMCLIFSNLKRARYIDRCKKKRKILIFNRAYISF